MKIAVLAGDGIGPEIIAQAVKVLDVLKCDGLKFEFEHAAYGGVGYDAHGDALPEPTLKLAKQVDAVLCGAVGGLQYDALPLAQRPEQGILRIRRELGLFANLRPVFLFEELTSASSLKPELVAGLDILIVRELTGDIYYGEPRGRRTNARGEREGYDTMHYSESEIRRIAEVAFRAAMKRGKKLCSVDKECLLESSRLWREVVNEVARDYPQVELSHMYVDNAALQLVRNPKQFDVIVTGNMFGDILCEEASILTGSIGMLPSASLDVNNKGLYDPGHGSAPDIAGRNIANPLATILSAAMMLRYTFNLEEAARRIEVAVKKALAQGYRTADIHATEMRLVGTGEMGDAVAAALRD